MVDSQPPSAGPYTEVLAAVVARGAGQITDQVGKLLREIVAEEVARELGGRAEQLDRTGNMSTDEMARLTADVVLLARRDDGELCVLLIRRGWDPFAGCWALPGGHVDSGEETLAAAQRELLEETGLHAHAMDLVGVYAAPGRDPRGRYVTFAYTTTLTGPPPAPVAGDDATEARWWPVFELAYAPERMAFDHNRILTDALRKEHCATLLSGETTPEGETTPALEQAAVLRALARHLARFPHLPTLYAGADRNLGISAWRDDEPQAAHAVLVWAKTLTDPQVTIHRAAGWDFTRVDVTGGLVNGTRITVHDGDRGDLDRWVDPERTARWEPTPITLERLAAYVAAGSVAGVTS